MNSSKASTFFKGVRQGLIKHSPAILTGVGIAGMITTTIMAVKATPKALELMEQKKDEMDVEWLTKKEIVQATWKCYIPTAVTGAASIACIIGGSSVNARRNAALLTAYNISQTALAEYHDKVVETIGEKKEKAVREAIVQDRINAQPLETSEVIVTENGTTLCYDAMFGRYFKSDRSTIEKAINKINREIVRDDSAPLNSFYIEIGLEPVDVGDDIGWNIDDGQIELSFSSHLAPDGTPCLAISYYKPPHYNFAW